MSDDQQTQREQVYRVVVNHEEQYSIWPVDRELPGGWRDGGKTGPKDECLAYIDEVWTDMRPLSLRKHMEEAARRAESQPEEEPEPEPEIEPLPIRLSGGGHPIVVSLRPEPTLDAFREALDRGYVFLKFTETRGGTELGVPIDREASDLSQADLDAGTGTVHLEGELTLDYIPVRCVADVDVASLTASGHLEVLEPVT
jgi:uncharacterized protein YbdZ (MbtH family)